MLKLGTGTASSQLIGVIAAPIVARLFSPEAFGGLAILAAVSGTVSIVACLRYEMAILLPEKEEEAAYLFWLCLFFVLVTTTVTAALIPIAGVWFWKMLGAGTLRAWAWLIPVNVFFAGVSALLEAWNTRLRQFNRLMIIEVILRISITGSQIALGLVGLVSAGVLMATTVFGVVVTAGILAVQTWRESSAVLLAGLSHARVVWALKRYATFPKFSAVATLLNSFSWHLPNLLLSGMMSVGIAGQFSFSNRLLRMPSKLVGSNFSQAFFPRAAEARLAGSLGTAVESAIAYLVKMSMFPCLVLALIGKDLFVVACGPKWAEAGVFTQILSFWLLAWFVASPLGIVFVVLEEQALELRFQIANVFVRGGPILIGALLGNARLAVLLFSLFGMGLYVIYSVMVMRKSGASAAKILKPIVSIIGIYIPAALLILWIRHLTPSPLPSLVAAFVLIMAYYSNLFRVDPAARNLLSGWIANFRASAAKSRAAETN